MEKRLRTIAMGAASVLLAACASPPERFYTLSAQGVSAPPGTQIAPSGADASVAVTAVTIPGSLDRPQMVRFVGDGRIDLTEEARWGEPLAHGIARTLAEDLRDRLNVPFVAAYPEDASAHARFRISVDMVHLDARAGDVLLDAIWTVRDTAPPLSAASLQPSGQAVLAASALSGHTVLMQPASASDASAMVLAQSAALAQLSDALAAAVKSLQGPR